MCGHVGCLGNINEAEKKMFRDMLIFDQVRGFDSTGVVIVPYATNLEPKIVKDLGAAQNLWEYDVHNNFSTRGIVTGGVNCLIGHNRAATLGAINVDNAHPFNFGDVYGAHNGSLRWWDELEGADQFDVDSKAIYNDISVNGVDHTWKSFWGAAALVWYNSTERKVYMIRNDERPLYVTTNKAENAMFWASEPWMFTVAAQRHKVELAKKKDGTTNYRQIETDTLYTFKVSISDFVFEGERKLEKKPLPSQTKNGSGTGFLGMGNQTNQDRSTKAGGLENRPFRGNKKWKQGTQRIKQGLGDVTISNIRHLDRHVNDRGPESVFRFDMFKNGTLFGRIDVYPTNKNEFNTLKTVELQDFSGKKGFKYELINNPRIDTRHPNGVTRYVCAFSSLKVKEFTFKSEDKVEQQGTNLVHLPMFKGRNGEDITLKEADDIIRECGDACCYCAQTIEPRDLASGMFLEKNEFLCPECTKNWGDDVQQLYGVL